MRSGSQARIILSVGIALLASVGIIDQTAQAQTSQLGSAVKTKPVPSKSASSADGTTDVNKVLKSAADSLGMLRSINRVDAINRMEYWASGTATIGGVPTPIEYHVTLSYNPPGLRVDVSRGTGAAAQHTIHVVNDKFAWDESEPGAGLTGSKGKATPDAASFKERYLQLWAFPYGAIKAAIAAGDQAKLSKENEAAVVSFPLSGKLSGIIVAATLNAKYLPTKVVTSGDIATEFDYSEYGDHGDDPSDVQFPGHIVEKQNGKIVLDLRVKMDDPNNPYAIFPTPDNVMKASN